MTNPIPAGAVDEAFDTSILMLVLPIVLLAIVGFVVSRLRRKQVKPATPYRTNARDQSSMP